LRGEALARVGVSRVYRNSGALRDGRAVNGLVYRLEREAPARRCPPVSISKLPRSLFWKLKATQNRTHNCDKKPYMLGLEIGGLSPIHTRDYTAPMRRCRVYCDRDAIRRTWLVHLGSAPLITDGHAENRGVHLSSLEGPCRRRAGQRGIAGLLDALSVSGAIVWPSTKHGGVHTQSERMRGRSQPRQFFCADRKLESSSPAWLPARWLI
jgi:hypothetical protein